MAGHKTMVIIFLSILTGFNTWAADIAGEKGKLKIDLVGGFTLHKDFLGLPYVMMDRGKGKKSSISLTPTGIGNMNLENGLLSGNYEQYKNGRKRWAEKRGHKKLDFIPFSSFENTSKARIVASGYKYERKDGTKNLERSFYVLCPKEAFHVKILTQNNNKGNGYAAELEEKLKKSSC